VTRQGFNPRVARLRCRFLTTLLVTIMACGYVIPSPAAVSDFAFATTLEGKQSAAASQARNSPQAGTSELGTPSAERSAEGAKAIDQKGPRATQGRRAMLAVPEPDSLLLVAIGLLLISIAVVGREKFIQKQESEVLRR